MPSIAVTLLGATPKQMAMMSIAGAVAFPALGMIAATLVEHSQKQRVMVAMDLGRMIAIGLVPGLAFVHRLNIAVVIGVCFAIAVMSVFHDIAYQSYLPAVVPRERINEGNTKLELSNTASQSVGPALAGIVMHAVSAPLAVLINAATYLVSALSVGSMRRPQRLVASPCARMAFFAELWEGLRYVAESATASVGGAIRYERQKIAMRSLNERRRPRAVHVPKQDVHAALASAPSSSSA